MMPAVGKSGAGHELDQLVDRRIAGCAAACRQASTTSVRLCGGMLVAMPTAMPDEPLTSRFGSRVGSTERLVLLAVVVRARSRRSPCRCRRAARAAIFARRHLGVAHRPRRVAVDRAEVALAVDQQVAQREVLRHAHERVVDRRVAVRVVLADARRRRCARTSCTGGSRRCSASCIANRTRRCTGFRPSRTSGSARPTITLIA